MKFFKIFLVLFILILISFRLALPYVLLNYVEKQINKIPEYRVKIEDLDVHLYRGAYTIKNIQLWKITKKIPLPFYQAKTMSFSVEWSALLHGKILAKIIIKDPKINFVSDPSGKNEQTSINSIWIDILKSLYPANIDRLDIHNGQISFNSFKGNPPFKIYLRKVEFTIQNMQKKTGEDKLLSSSYKFQGIPEGGGQITSSGKFDPFNKQPTFKFQIELKSLKVKNIADFLKHYTAIDIQGGVFSLFGEVVAAKGRITGYVKPFIKDLKIGQPKNKNPFSAIVDGAANLAAKILENSKKKTIATKVNISGNVDDPDTSILSIIIYLIRHAFIQALLPQIDHTVEMQDILYGEKPNAKSKFPQYRD